jgi:hypothetical protein
MDRYGAARFRGSLDVDRGNGGGLRFACMPCYLQRMFAPGAMMTTTIMTIPLGEGECRSVLV